MSDFEILLNAYLRNPEDLATLQAICDLIEEHKDSIKDYEKEIILSSRRSLLVDRLKTFCKQYDLILTEGAFYLNIRRDILACKAFMIEAYNDSTVPF